ncbi:hypothetical protein [Caminibacter pacificus]|jgi:hypothetical protein
MNVLFRLDKSLEGFEDINAARNFFRNIIPTTCENYFYHTQHMRQLREGDIIYFAYDKKIIATATYDGEQIENPNYNEKFKIGHKISNINIIYSTREIDSNIFKGRAVEYIKTPEQEQEIQRVLT